MEKIHTLTKSFQRLFNRKSSIDLAETTTTTTLTSLSHSNSTNSTSQAATSSTNQQTNNHRSKNAIHSLSNSPASSITSPPPGATSSSSSSSVNNHQNSKHFNTITSQHVTLSHADTEHLAQLHTQYVKFTYYDQYAILQKTIAALIDVYKSLDAKNYLPRLQYVQFLFDLMEANVNVFNLMLFAIRLLHVGPLIEKYLRAKFVSENPTSSSSSNKIVYFEYVSHFYLIIVGVLRLHSISLVMWKDLASQVFRRYVV